MWHVDEETIARGLRQAIERGELQGSRYYGRPLPEDDAWQQTPASLRLAFRVLRTAGCVPAEVLLLRRRAQLVARRDACDDAAAKDRLQAELVALERTIALRLEDLRRRERP